MKLELRGSLFKHSSQDLDRLIISFFFFDSLAHFFASDKPRFKNAFIGSCALGFPLNC